MSIDRVLEMSDGLADPAAVVFGLATEYVGPWLAVVMAVLLLTSLFGALLALQNSAARYFFALGRSGVVAPALSRVNGRGAPGNASLVTSVITGLVIVLFAVLQLDPVLNLFYWFSGLAVVAIVLIEILVCIAVIAFFRKNRVSENIFQTVIAPVLATLGLIIGEYLLMSRFGLLAGTVAEGVDPTTTSWGLSITGWVLILLPFVLWVAGWIYSRVRTNVNTDLLKDIVS
jgi:amino acid transporter